MAFPNEPLIRVTAPIIEAQLVETFLLNTINLQTMIATKASRVVHAAKGKSVIEFGLRREHGIDAGMKVARSSYIAGCQGTSNVLSRDGLWHSSLRHNGALIHNVLPQRNRCLPSVRQNFPKQINPANRHIR